jgi:hypothetical protein
LGALIWGLLAGAVVATGTVLEHHGHHGIRSLMLAGQQLFLLIFYAALWLAPMRWILRRPALVRYSKFLCVFSAMKVTAGILSYYKQDVVYCFDVTIIWVLGSTYAWLIFVTLLADSNYWLGLFEEPSVARAPKGTMGIRDPLVGTPLPKYTASSLAYEVCSLCIRSISSTIYRLIVFVCWMCSCRWKDYNPHQYQC